MVISPLAQRAALNLNIIMITVIDKTRGAASNEMGGGPFEKSMISE